MSASYTTAAARYLDTGGDGSHNRPVDRRRLIDRKHEVIAEIARLRRRIDHARATTAADRRSRRRIARLEAELDRLAAEESRLRGAIDRTGG